MTNETQGPVYSPDGQWIWSGQDWIPAPPPSPPVMPMPPAQQAPVGSAPAAEAAWSHHMTPPPVAATPWHKRSINVGDKSVGTQVFLALIAFGIVVGGILLIRAAIHDSNAREQQNQNYIDCARQDLTGQPADHPCPGQ